MIKSTRLQYEGKPVWKVYVATHNGNTYHIDGQQGTEEGSHEWRLYVLEDTHGWGEEHVWVDTLPTKKAALEAIEGGVK